MKAELGYCIDDVIAKNTLILNNYDEDYLHQIRISLRKLKSLICFFKDYISKDELEIIKPILHLLIAPTSKVRDYDVFKANYIYPAYFENNHDDSYKTFMIHSINELHCLQENTLSFMSSREYIKALTNLKLG